MKALVLNSKVLAVGNFQLLSDRLKLNFVEYLYSAIQGYQLIDCNIEVDTGWTYLNGEFIPPPAAKPPVPQTVTRRQAKQALALAGLLDSVEGALAAIPDVTTRKLATIEWQDSQEFQRNRPLVIQLATSLGLTSDDLDNLFITAATL